jgi:hypothetical protein
MSEYKIDIALWSERQASLLRRRAAGELVNDAEFDWPNIAEEIESLARSDRRELRHRIVTIIEHLAKLESSPSLDPLPGWRETIIRARDDIDTVLEESPSLRRELDGMIERERPKALRYAERALQLYGETPRRQVSSLVYTTEQVMGPWLP